MAGITEHACFMVILAVKYAIYHVGDITSNLELGQSVIRFGVLAGLKIEDAPRFVIHLLLQTHF